MIMENISIKISVYSTHLLYGSLKATEPYSAKEKQDMHSEDNKAVVQSKSIGFR